MLTLNPIPFSSPYVLKFSAGKKQKQQQLFDQLSSEQREQLAQVLKQDEEDQTYFQESLISMFEKTSQQNRTQLALDVCALLDQNPKIKKNVERKLKLGIDEKGSILSYYFVLTPPSHLISKLFQIKVFTAVAECIADALPENPKLKAQMTEMVTKYAKGPKKGNQAFLKKYINRTFDILKNFFEQQTELK